MTTRDASTAVERFTHTDPDGDTVTVHDPGYGVILGVNGLYVWVSPEAIQGLLAAVRGEA